MQLLLSEILLWVVLLLGGFVGETKAFSPFKVVDTTGAGDAFTGALIFFLVEMAQLDVGEAIKRACYVASISVQKEGTQSSYPGKEDLQKWLLE